MRVGGGFNHRQRLDDGILIKDNHITAAGGIAPAVAAARAGAPHGVKVEVECTTLDEVDEALAAQAEILLLDNMSVEQMRRRRAPRRRARHSRSLRRGHARQRARRSPTPGVDIISVGALTHSAPAVDLHMTLSLE